MKAHFSLTRRDVNVIIACLLSFSILMMPFASIAAASGGSERQSRVSREQSSQAGQVVATNAALPAPAPLVATVTATKSGAILNDDGDSKADPTNGNPGTTEKIEYTVTISNTGTTDATNVTFTDTIDAHTTLVDGSITTQPIAVNDAYSALGNVRIQVPDGASDLLNNDCDPDPLGGACTNAGLTISVLAGDNSAPFAGTSTNGGNVTATTGDGSFEYNPAPGFEGADSFTYTVVDSTGKTDTATVNITVSGMIWFVNAAAGGGGDGRLTNPFNCLVGTGCFQPVAADDAGDFIFMFSGTYNDNAALALLNNQKLIGAAATAPLAGPGSITGFTVPAHSDALPGTGLASPVINSTASGIQLANGNLLRGFTVGNTSTVAGNYDILNTAALTVGTLNISEVILNGTGGLFRADSGGTLNVSFPTATTTSAGSHGVHLAGTTSGSVSLGGGAISGVAGTDVVINGGTVALSCASSITHAANSAMVDIANHATGVVTFSAALSASNGTGIQFNNADSSYNFNGTNTLQGGDAGLDITNGSSGTFTFSAATSIVSPTSGPAINVASSPGTPTLNYNGSVTDNTAGQRAVNIDGTTGGAISINSVTTGSVAGGVGNTGININNANGSVTFTTLTLGASGTRLTAQAVTIAGGSGAKNLGTVNIFTTGSAEGIHSTTSTGAISITTGNIDTTGAAAVNIAGTSAASRTPLNIQLIKVNTTGGSNGVVLSATSQTGSPGGFNILGNTAGLCGGAANPGSVSGTAPVTADCSGGQIQTSTGANGGNPGIGILLTDVDKISLTRVRVNGHSNYGLKGTNVTNFTLTSSYFHNNGDDVSGDGEGSVYLYGLTGSAGQNSITNCFLDLGAARNLHVLNTSGTLDRLTVSGTTIGNDGTSGSDGIFVQADNSANTAVAVTLKVTVQNGRFNGSRGDGMQFSARGTSTTDFVFTGNRMTNNHPNQVSGSTAVTLSAGGLAGSFNPNNTFNISNNIINNNSANNGSGPAISVGKGGVSADASFVGTISGNTIGTAGVANSGSAQGSGIVVDIVGGGVMNATITNNTIRQFTNFGILAQSGNVTAGGGTGNLIVDIRGNNIAEPSPASAAALFPTSGIRFVAGTNAGDNTNNCVTLGGLAVADKNTVTGTGTNGASEIRLFQRFVTILAVPGYAGASNQNGPMNEFIAARNNVTDITPPIDTASVNATHNSPTGPGWSGTCTAPTSGPISELMKPDTGQQATSMFAMTAAPTQAVVSATANEVSSSLLTRAVTAVANFAGGVLSLIEPTAHAEAAAPVVKEQSPARTGKTSHHATIKRPIKTESLTKADRSRTSTPLAAPVAVAGETVGPIIIGTLRAGDSVTITFEVTVNNPPNLTGVPPGVAQVTNQGTVNFNDGATPLSVNTNTVNTPVDLFNTTTTLVSDLNPSDFGDTVTFTATVAEDPAQPSVDPTGTVDFIDTSNGNAIVCDNVALTGGAAECQTSTLTPGTHNIRADYSGDGNFEPSQSNVVEQVVNACTQDPIVTSTADAGAGSLREALGNVCAGDTITFNIPDAGPHTIALTTGELVVDTGVTIKNDSGESITVSGGGLSRVFNINPGKTAAIIGLTISGGQSATSGGGILNDGTLTIVNSTLTGNNTSIDGGAISNSAPGILTLINTTISGNNATGNGGGVVNLGGTVTSVNSTFTNNFADSDANSIGTGGGIHHGSGTTTLHNTIVAGNFNEDGGTDAADDISGTVNSASSFNLIGTGGAGGLTNGANNNQVGVADAGLGPLANNGGTTQTHALSPTSAAVETGGNANLPADTFDLDGDADLLEALPVDQRGLGFPRNADSQDANTTQTVDIGAFELHPSIEDIANQSTDEDTVKNVPFNIGDDTGSLIASVTATSSNTTLVPNANLVITGSGGSRNLEITPAANQSGLTTITVTVTATNGRTAVDTFDLTVNAVNDAPVANDDSYSTDEDTPLMVDAANGVLANDTDTDTPLSSLTAILVNGPSNALSFTLNGDGSFNYTPNANFNGPDTFTYKANDGSLDSNVATVTITVNAINDAPTLAINAGITVAEGSTNNTITSTMLRVDDVDNTAAQIVFTIGTAPVNGTLKKSGVALAGGGTFTQDDIDNNRITYDHDGSETTSDSFTFTVSDGAGGTIGLTTFNITITAQNDAPSITAGGTLNYTENDPATAIDTTITVTDVDSTNLASATITINVNYVNGQDVLSFTNTANISGGFNAATGMLTLTGSDTVANYEAALRTVKYNNTSDDPSTASRTVSWSVKDDGDLTSNVATSTINVTAVNDAPVNTVPGPQSTNQNTPLTFSSGNGNQISVADVDAGTNAIQVTLTATNGTLTLNGTSGLSFMFSDANGTGAGDGTADATMTFRGTIANINTALNGMTFTPDMGFSGAASLTITSNDLGNTGTGGPLSDTDVVNIQVATNISIQDAQVAEPDSGSVNMVFTVTLSAPAPAGGASVDFTTVQEAPALNHATAGDDYTTTSGTINFAAGEQVKTINVPILSDNKKNEVNETFLVVLSNPVNAQLADDTATGTILVANQAGTIVISEFRSSGPDGAGDEFVEIHNNTDSAHTVAAGGYGLFKMGASCSATPVLIGTIPAGTVIPARGHYLFTGSAYSLANYGGTGTAAGDATLTADLGDGENFALFNTTSVAGLSSVSRLDAVGFGTNTGGVCDLLREGTTLTPLPASVLEYTYFRDECGKKGNPAQFGACPSNGFAMDSNNNNNDFIFADTQATMTPAGQRLGAPGPQNLGSPRLSLSIAPLLLDNTKGSTASPNRVRDTGAIGPNAATGTLSIRRRFVNNTGAPVTRLRFRVVDISAFPVPNPVADLRVLSSTQITVTGVQDSATCLASNGSPATPCTVTVEGTTLETPPAQPLGGAINSSLTAGTIVLATPLAPGASINLQFLLGVQATGSFKFFFNIEALP